MGCLANLEDVHVSVEWLINNQDSVKISDTCYESMGPLMNPLKVP